MGKQARKVKERTQQTWERGVWWGKHIVSRCISELLSKLLLCYHIKEALPFYGAIPSDNKKISTSTQYFCILFLFLKEIMCKLLNNLADRNFWKKRSYIQSMKICECLFPVYSNSSKRMFSSELLQKYLYLTWFGQFCGFIFVLLLWKLCVLIQKFHAHEQWGGRLNLSPPPFPTLSLLCKWPQGYNAEH